MMADELSLLVGRLDEGFNQLQKRIDRSDEQTDAKINSLAEQHAQDKQEAIVARAAKETRDDQKHADNIVRFTRIEEKATQTYGTTMGNAKWIEEKGDPLIEAVGKLDIRVRNIEDKRKLTAAETRGGAKVWAQVIAAGGALGGIVGGTIAYWKDAVEFIRGLHHG